MTARDRWPAELVGGHPALDLLNTVSWRLDPARTIDRLSDDHAVVRWANAVGLIDRRSPDEPRITQSVVEVREIAYAVLSPIAIGDQPDPAAVERLRKSITGALAVSRIASVSPLRWTVGSALADLPAILALQVWRLLEDESLERLKQCRDGGCGWLFLDRTKNSSRRWCSSADCGNRSRARRHYQRRREQA